MRNSTYANHGIYYPPPPFALSRQGESRTWQSSDSLRGLQLATASSTEDGAGKETEKDGREGGRQKKES